MPAHRYDIYFSGTILKDTDPVSVKQKIAGIFNTSNEQLEYLFSGTAVKIKSNVDQETAIKYRTAFKNAGALIEIRSTTPCPSEHEKQPPETVKTGSTRTTETMTLLPPNTGNLIDCARTIQAAPLPNIDNLTLASLGALLDETKPTPPLQIDTSKLQLTPVHTGTLEDCQVQIEPSPLPDISRLKIIEGDD